MAAFVDPPFVFYLYLGRREPDPADATDISHWLTWGHHMRFDDPRRRESSVLIPFRFRAFDFAEYHYMLLLGALHALSMGAFPAGRTAELERLSEMRLAAINAEGQWQLSDLGREELANAPILADRWQRPASTRGR